MGLNRRQERAYYLIADIYRPLPSTVGLDNDAQDLRYPQLPTARNVRIRHQQSQEDNAASVTGRGTGDYAENIDRFKMSRDIDIEDSYIIHVRSKIESDDGVFYLTSGGANDRPAINRRRANQRSVSAKKIPKPAEITPPAVTDEKLI